jgi:hypothetical protein
MLEADFKQQDEGDRGITMQVKAFFSQIINEPFMFFKIGDARSLYFK